MCNELQSNPILLLLGQKVCHDFQPMPSCVFVFNYLGDLKILTRQRCLRVCAFLRQLREIVSKSRTSRTRGNKVQGREPQAQRAESIAAGEADPIGEQPKM